MGLMGLKSRGWQGLVPSGDLAGGGVGWGSVPCLFHLLEGAPIPQLVATPFQPLSPSHLLPSLCFQHHITFSDSDLPASVIRTSVITLGLPG